MNHTPLPWRPLRAWEGYYEPEPEELAHEMARPFTRIEGPQDRTVINAHDLFTFRPGDAEYICRACNAFPELVAALRDLRDAATDAYKAGRIPAEPFVRAGNVLARCA